MGNIAVGIGEILWDMLPEGRKLGGAPANFAYHVSQFGLESCIVSAVGEDSLGYGILDTIRSKGLDERIATVPYSTGTVDVKLDSDGIPRYNIKEGVAWDSIPFTEELGKLASETSAVCFGSLAQRNLTSRETIGRFLDAMPDRKDTLKIFDINLRQDFYTRETVEASLEKCNILKINDEELAIVSRMLGYAEKDQEKRCRNLMDRYSLKVLILTCGVNGSYVFVPGEVSFIETPKVKVADTVGAGDSFTGSFTAALMKGMKVQDAHRLAVDVSAYVCSQAGAMPVLPDNLRSRLE